MMRPSPRWLVPVLALVLAGRPVPLPAQALNARSVAQLIGDRQRLTGDVFRLMGANRGGEALAGLKDLVQTEREILAFMERTIPFNEPCLLYYGSMIGLRSSLASNLQWLTGLDEEHGDLDAALAGARELLALHVRYYGADHWETADARRLIADLERRQATGAGDRRELAEAKALNRRVLRLGEEGNWLESFPLAERALAIRERILGADHPECATSLNNLAGSYEAIGDHARAESLYRRALEIRTRVLGEHHPHFANSLNNLAYLYLRMGDSARAEPLVRRALEVNREARGADHPDTAASLTNLAALYFEQGNYDKAAPLFLQDLEDTRRLFGEDHARWAVSLTNLAGLLMARGDRARAESLYSRALEVRTRVLGEQHPLVAASLNNLAVVFFETGRYDKAESLFRRALEIRRRANGESSLDSAQVLSNLAELLRATGDTDRAEPLCRQALEIRTSILGGSHPFTAYSSSQLSLILAVQGRWDEAVEVMDRSRRALRTSIGRVLPSLSARDRLSYLSVAYRSSYHSALALGLARTEDARLAERSAGWLLNGKAVVRELLAERDLTARESNDPEVVEAARKLRAVRVELARRTLAGTSPGREEEDRRRLARLGQQEQELSRTLAQPGGLRQRSDDWVEVDEVRRALPADSVLVEVAVCHLPDLPRKGGPIPEPGPRYAAWIIPPGGQGDVRIVDLGPAEPIVTNLAAFRQAINTAAATINERGEAADEAELKKLLEAIADRVLRPLEPVLSRSTRWLISPDAALWLVPWGALPLDDGSYSLRRHTIRYLVSGRDLVERARSSAVARGGLVLADPDYDREALPRRDAAPGLAATRTSATPLPSDWPRLPGTAEEATAVLPKIERFLGTPPRLVTGPEAIEDTIKSARSPRVVVLSTHGFFFKDQDLVAPPVPGQLTLQSSQRPEIGVEDTPLENPLLRCGLILAGANRRDRATDPKGDDGVLTGLEIVGTDLRGTELVVLSACETGHGVIHNGEDVAGLRQAFQLAGARAVVSTLWQIPDEETVWLMTRFWEDLAAGKEPADALSDAQLGLINERLQAGQTSHPFFWAAFTLTGQATSHGATRPADVPPAPITPGGP